jgi:hypothetical protein
MVDHFELVVFGLLVAVAGLVLLSDVLGVPYPIFLVLGCTVTAAASAPPATPVPLTNASRTSPRTSKPTATTRTLRHARRPSNASGASFWRRSAKPYCA